MDKWVAHFKDMVLNKLPHKDIYIVSDANQIGNGEIKVVSPTEQSVLQAKSSLKRGLVNDIPKIIKAKKFKKSPQSGSGQRKGKKPKLRKKKKKSLKKRKK